jgi:hypothetical protein
LNAIALNVPSYTLGTVAGVRTLPDQIDGYDLDYYNSHYNPGINLTAHVCFGASATLSVADLYDYCMQGASVSWSPAGQIVGSTTGKTIHTANLTMPTTFTATITRTDGCVIDVHVAVGVSEPGMYYPTEIIETCEGSPLTLTAGCGPGLTAYWPDFSLTSPTYEIPSAYSGTFHVLCKDAWGCVIGDKTIEVIAYPPPPPYGVSVSICYGQTIDLSQYLPAGGLCS